MSESEEERTVTQPPARAINTTINPTSDVADAALNPQAQDAIGAKLRQLYGEMVAAPLPDKFTELLNSLTRTETK